MNKNDYIIRLETKNDYREVENLAREAFWNLSFPGCDEHYFIHVMRDHKSYIPELGYILEKDGKIIVFETKAVCITCIVSVVCGILLSLDYWTFGAVIPQIRQADAVGLSFVSLVSSLLYGGICEELLLRLFVLSLFAFIIWKIFFRKSITSEKNEVPKIVFLIANIVASLLFAADRKCRKTR